MIEVLLGFVLLVLLLIMIFIIDDNNSKHLQNEVIIKELEKLNKAND